MFRRPGIFVTPTLPTSGRTTMRMFTSTTPLFLSATGQQQVLSLRKEIAELWNQNLGGSSGSGGEDAHSGRSVAVRSVMDRYGLHPDTLARAAENTRQKGQADKKQGGDPDDTTAASTEQSLEDYSRSLGEHFDRLLLMLVPATKENIPYIERLLDVAAKNELKVQLKTVQHMFARTATYAEALILFHSLRKCRVAMSTESYFAMIFCLQRLEEESWGKRYHEMLELNYKQHEEKIAEVASTSSLPGSSSDTTAAALTEQRVIDNATMEFIVNGCENQLMPESKPWLGKVLLENTEVGRQRSTEKEFDMAADMWVERYKNGEKQATGM